MAACATCGTDFEPKRQAHQYCSAACRLQAFVARRDHQWRERDTKLRLLLREALELLKETER